MANSGLIKMTLTPWEDISFKTMITDIPPYRVLINPETYTISYSQEVNVQPAQGNNMPIVTYSHGDTQTMNFKFLFDGTGVIKEDKGILSGLASGLAIPGVNATTLDVATELGKFKKVAYDFYPKTHRPPFVKIEWGLLSFNCLLTSMNISFKLFKPDGTPLRAEADCTFRSAIDIAKSIATMSKQSPDLTHIRTVKEGDTLSLMCHREYGDSKYYYQVAQFNGLTDFKNLTPGTKLSFPPLTKN